MRILKEYKKREKCEYIAAMMLEVLDLNHFNKIYNICSYELLKYVRS